MWCSWPNGPSIRNRLTTEYKFGISKQLVILVAFFWLSADAGRRRIPDWQIRIAQKQGPNTCAVEEVTGINKKYWTECKYWANREICGHKTVLRYECCEGYQQVAGKHGCTGVKPMSDVVETARNLGAGNFADLLVQTGIAERLKKEGGAHTLFAPTNEAFKNMKLIYKEIFNHTLQDPDLSPLLYHITPRKIHSRSFGANLVTGTLLGGPGLRINRYSNGMMTVNCAPIARKDQEATDGLVHLLDQVMLPPSADAYASVPEVIFYDGRFRELSRALLQSKLVNELRSGVGPYTVFAPSDEAFQKIGPKELERISGDVKAQTALLRNHIVPHAVCPSAIIGNHKMKTLGGEKLEFSCDGKDTFINKVKVTGETIAAKNGMVVVVDGLLIPDEVKKLASVIQEHNDLNLFTEIAKIGQLEEMLKDLTDDITIFAPSDEAFKELSEQQLEKLKTDSEEARALLNYHTVHGSIATNDITDNQRIDTLDKQNVLRLKVYRKAVGIESAILTEKDIAGQNGILHVIDKVLFAPDFSTLDLFRKDTNFSVFADAIEKVQESEPGFLTVFENSSFTIFAPNDAAFKRLGNSKMDSLMEDPIHLKQVLQNHVVDTMLSSGSFHSKLVYKLPTENHPVEVRKEHGGGITVNGAHVLKRDLMTKEGIVHCIDKVLVDD